MKSSEKKEEKDNPDGQYQYACCGTVCPGLYDAFLICILRILHAVYPYDIVNFQKMSTPN